jgi:hypothetical protein
MLQTLKLWKLSSALKSRDPQESYSAVRDLARLGSPGAVDLLIEALRGDVGVARAAARELGLLGDARAVGPLVALLGNPDLNTVAAEALGKMGSVGQEAVVVALTNEDPMIRRTAASILGTMGDKQAVEPLANVLQTDNEYAVRTAAATALGHLRDSRGVWALVGTLKLRDETSHDRREALANLRQAAEVALRRIGDPLAVKQAEAGSPLARMESALSEADVHPRLVGDLTLLGQADLMGVLQELVAASEEITWAKLESRQPLLAAYFREYHQRRNIAEAVGRELFRRGGQPLLDTVLKQINNYQSIQNWWAGMNES